VGFNIYLKFQVEKSNSLAPSYCIRIVGCVHLAISSIQMYVLIQHLWRCNDPFISR